ncbi:MAG: hypothetical protein ACE5DI_01960 [Candidatus Micrarchaeia archaeon]
MGFFERGIPRPVWGDVFLAAGLAVAGLELWKIATVGVGSVFLEQARDGILFVAALILFSTGSALKRE